jgi:thiol-disulfide isomerase/thioredoxin
MAMCISQIAGALLFVLTFSQVVGAGGPPRSDSPLIDRFDANARSPMEQAGVGVALARRDGQLFVGRVLPDTPADRSGTIHKGDRLIAVGHQNQQPVDVKGMPIEKVVPLIRGPKGTVVILTIIPAGKTVDEAIVVPLTRGTIKGLNRFGDGRYIPLGTQAPDVNAAAMANGAPYKLKSSRGKIVVLEFWESGCGPCLKGLDQLQKWRDQHPEWQDRVSLLAVGVDDEQKLAMQCVKDRGRGWTTINVVWTGPDALKSFHIDGLPTVYVLDTMGQVVAADHWVDLPTVLKKALNVGQLNRRTPSDRPNEAPGK